MSAVASPVSIVAQPEALAVSGDAHARRRSALLRQTWVSLFPWMLVSFVSIMAFSAPNVIVTPLTWTILLTIWSYPAVALVGYCVSLLCGRSPRHANLVLAVPASIGAFLFTMLLVPWVVFPLFADGYFGLMASCLLSSLIAGNWVRRVFR